jgi:hypothetical protein
VVFKRQYRLRAIIKKFVLSSYQRDNFTCNLAGEHFELASFVTRHRPKNESILAVVFMQAHDFFYPALHRSMHLPFFALVSRRSRPVRAHPSGYSRAESRAAGVRLRLRLHPTIIDPIQLVDRNIAIGDQANRPPNAR